MTRSPAVLARRLLRTGLPLVVLVAGTATAHDSHHGSRQLRVEEADGEFLFGDYALDPSTWGGFFDRSYAEGDLTGGVVFCGASSGDAAAIAAMLGYQVDELYDGCFSAEPGEDGGDFDEILLSQAINGADPYAFAEPDFFMQGPEGSQLNGIVLGSTYGRAQFQRQPALTSIHANAAHRYESGAGAVVAVLDTGVDATHTQLAGHVLAGWDFVDGHAVAAEGAPDGFDQDLDGTPDDGFGHGTTVAGIVLGAAPDASILPVRVLDVESVGTAGRVAAGISYALDNGANVINLSLGGSARSSAVAAQITAAIRRGVIVVAAAGNSKFAFAPDFPASEPGVVAATGRVGAPGDVSAPFSNVSGPYPDQRWYRGTGSSFAAALVSGGAALAVEAHPGIDGFGFVAALGAVKRGTARLDLLRLVR